MDFKNNLKFDLKKIFPNEVIEIDGISFSNITYILAFIDEINLFDLDFFKESFLVFKELERSTLKSGKYLLFTGISGVADDAGWEYIEVLHEKDIVSWNIQRDDNKLFYVFDKIAYLKEVFQLGKEIERLSNEMKLEPLYVIYPE